MTNQEKNVPELRFPEFDGEWEEKKLGDIGSVAMNKRIYKNETTNHGEIPFYKIGTFGKKAETFISREKFEEYKEKYPYPNKGDILISASGSIGRTIEYDGEEAYYQDSNIVWLQHNNEVLNVFLKYFYLIVKWNGIEGTTIKRLYNKNILNTKIELPVKEEQQKIGEFFSKLDRQIELEEQKLAKLEEQKKGYMQKIFSQEFRFKDENGNNYPEWEETNLGNLLVEINQKSTLNDQYLLLSSTKNGLVNQSDYFKKQIGSKDNTGYKILRLNQMVISPQNLWLGNINFNDQFEIGIVSPSYRIYEFNSKVTFQFLKYLLKTSRYIYEYGQASEQGASVVRRNLNLDLFYEIKVNLPKLVEQEKIGNFFKKIDKSIDKQFNKVELLKERKKGFLQKMFV